MIAGLLVAAIVGAAIAFSTGVSFTTAGSPCPTSYGLHCTSPGAHGQQPSLASMAGWNGP
ncbi:MAG: hypothetical protein ACJ764_01965 [Solirubrobacteraceae bacterium]